MDTKTRAGYMAKTLLQQFDKSYPFEDARKHAAAYIQEQLDQAEAEALASGRAAGLTRAADIVRDLKVEVQANDPDVGIFAASEQEQGHYDAIANELDKEASITAPSPVAEKGK